MSRRLDDATDLLVAAAGPEPLAALAVPVAVVGFCDPAAAFVLALPMLNPGGHTNTRME